MRICSPLSSTFVVNNGELLFIFLIPSSFLGYSEGSLGSQATFTTDYVLNLIYFIISILLSSLAFNIVAVFYID